MNLKIHSIHFDADQKLVSFVQDRVNKLEQFYDNIIGGEVYLRLEKGVNGNDNKVAEIRLNIPGKELFAKKHAKSFEESTDVTVEALRRQIKRHKEKLQKV
ncbi:MAG: ribosome-associated translation inhibitor RaiA [Flavobacteriales bacterium]|nr:ribosome-associated translation inhibitor RaiA [Flavobacteriales bacterium]MCB9447453.1 ribosome-associated translation inhibitor RaiA [Flavobacteriales bacterium]